MAICTAERRHPRVLTLRFDQIYKGWERWFLIRADAHHDNLLCNQKLERRHLEEAKERDAIVLDFGDLFCAMQGKWDARADNAQLRPELQSKGNRYLDELVRYAADFYQPYAANWFLWVPGNHETAITKRHNTDLTERLAERMKAGGSPGSVGTYHGWVRFLFCVRANERQSMNLYYTHGYGGGGPVTRDVIQSARQMVYTDADVIVSAHTHDCWHVPIEREHLRDSGRPEMATVDCVKPGTYKDEFSEGNGWAAEKGRPPKPIGAYWMRLFYYDGRINREFIRAK